LGSLTADIHPANDKSPTLGAETEVAQSMQASAANADTDQDVSSRAYMSLLHRYLSGTSAAATTPCPAVTSASPASTKVETEERHSGTDSSSGKSLCLLCENRRPYVNRSALTRHYKNAHVKESFGRPFSCPECRRLRLGEFIVDCPSG